MKFAAGLLAVPLLIVSMSGFARDTTLHLPVAPVLADPEFAQQAPGGIRFYFGDAAAPQGTDLGEFITNKKTNAFNKSDEEACNWVLKSALLQLRSRAQELGADAVVDITSFYKRQPYSSTTLYECHAGGIMAGVALKAHLIRTK